MAAITPVSSATPSNTVQGAYGLDFQSLLKIVLTELTYQDPLKPVDNYEFVSQLGQFSQLQQSQTLNSTVTQLLSAQSATQATGLIGRTVDVSASGGLISGEVSAIAFSNGQPEITIKTSDGQTLSGLSIANVSQIR